MKKAHGGPRKNAGRPKNSTNTGRNTEDLTKKLSEDTRMYNEVNIFYVPCFNEISKGNYDNTVIDRHCSINSEQRVKDIINQNTDLNVSDVGVWAFKEGKINNRHYNNMMSGDIVLFLIKDEEGYQCIDSIAYIGDLFKDETLGEKLWGDSDYKNLLLIDKLVKLKNPLRLSIKRKSIVSVEGIPTEVFHSAYEMFRQWNLNKKDEKNKFLPEKHIEESEFIDKILKAQGADILYNNINNYDYEYNAKQNSNGLINETEEAVFSIEDSIMNLNIAKLENEIEANISLYENDTTENELSMSKKRNKESKNTTQDKLSKKAKYYLGMQGEQYIYSILKNNNANLLNVLEIEKDEIESIEWYNENYNIEDENWQDKSVGRGHDIKVNSKKRTIFIEVKTSYNNITYYNITRNELVANAKFKDNYYVIKINNIKYYDNDSKRPDITVLNNPLDIFLNDLAKIRELSLYI